VLSGDTSQQKMFLMVGPKRSGKGTIGRVLTHLIGPHNVAGNPMSSLGTNFGLQPLVDKPLLVMSDARMPRDNTVVGERLLSISGEDMLTVDRKYRDHWTGKLPTRILILTNELPNFDDSSGALASRFVVLSLEKSWYGKEDPDLTAKLLTELAGIFNWALEGLDRLHWRGRFVQPEAALEHIREMEQMASPTGAFVNDMCVVGPQHQITVDRLYSAYRRWCAYVGRDHIDSKAIFGRNLRAVVPTLRSTRPTDPSTGERYYAFQGITLSE